MSLAASLLLSMAPSLALGAESRSDAEWRRAQERTQVQRQRMETEVDVSTSPFAQSTERLPGSEFPCFPTQRLQLDVADLATGAPGALPNDAFNASLDAILAATAGPDGDDSPIGKCLGTRGIEMVLQRAQKWLVQRGYVTTRILATQQDLGNGTLLLTLVPGHVHAIRFTGIEAPTVSTINTLPQRPGNVLNLHAIEQGLENLQRVPTAQADIRIEPAQAADARNQSDLLITYQQRAPARVSITADDSGSQGTGKYQGSATLSLDNPLGVSDLFYYTSSHDLGGGDPGPRGTRGGTLHYSLPLHYWLLSSTHSNNRYFQSVAGAAEVYVYSGTSESTEISLSRAVYRDATRKTRLSLKAWQRRSNNYVDDTEVLVQRRALGGWELGTHHKEAVGDATLEGSFAYKRGVKNFDAIVPPEEAFHAGTSQFGLITLDLNASVPFKAGAQSGQYSAALRLQNNTTPLTPQDRFAIGGRYSVRGFDGASSLVGERGWRLRNDWSVAFGPWGQNAYLGVDAGEVSGPCSDTLRAKTLTGAVVGLRGTFKHLKSDIQYDFFVGAPLYQPPAFKTAETTAGFTVSMSL